jgi:PST family polysaccharide transporter
MTVLENTTASGRPAYLYEGEDPSEDISKRSLKALKWNWGGSAVRIISQLLIGILLARMLGPEPFGIIAIAWIVLGLGNLIADGGFTAAIIQKREISEEDIRYVFTIQVLFGICLTALIMFPGTDLATSLLGKPEAGPALRWMSLVFLFQSLGQTASALLKRNLEFKAIQITQSLSYVGSYLLVGIPLALMGKGVWSLVVAQLLQVSSNAAAAYWLVKHPIKPCFAPEKKEILRFGSSVVGANVTYWAITNVDSIFVGRIFPIADVGIYTRAFQLVYLPMNSIVSGAQSVLYSACSKIQANEQAVRQVYAGSLSAMGMICLPLFLPIAAISNTVIAGLLGHKWVAAAPLLAPFALAMSVHALLAISGSVITATGHPSREFKSVITVTLVMIPIYVIASGYSTETMAWAVFAIRMLLFAVLMAVVVDITGISYLGIMRSLREPMLLSVSVAACAAGTDALLETYVAFPELRLALVALVIVGAICIGWRILRSSVLNGPAGPMLRELKEGLPLTIRYAVFGPRS